MTQAGRSRPRTTRPTRHAVALTVVLAGVLALAAAGGSRAGSDDRRLLPDLVTLAIQQGDLVISGDRGRRVLRFSNELANRGDGPLEIAPSPGPGNCDGDRNPDNDRTATQRVFADANGSGRFEAGVDLVAVERRVGCIRYHPSHGHWHVLKSAGYELRSEPRGRLATARQKAGFCLGDNRFAFPGPGVSPEPVYPFGSTDPRQCDGNATQGLSIGHADLYALGLPGQRLRVEGLRRGRYCLISRADPARLIAESDERNNVRRTLLRLRPARYTVEKLAGRCRA